MADFKRANDNRAQDAREKIAGALETLRATGKRIGRNVLAKILGCSPNAVSKHRDLWSSGSGDLIRGGRAIWVAPVLTVLESAEARDASQEVSTTGSEARVVSMFDRYNLARFTPGAQKVKQLSLSLCVGLLALAVGGLPALSQDAPAPRNWQSMSPSEQQEAREAEKRGDGYFELKKYKQAVEQYQKAPPLAARRLGECYLYLKDFEKAAPLLDATKSYMKAGDAYYALKNYERAAFCYNEEYSGRGFGINSWNTWDIFKGNRGGKAGAYFKTGDYQKSAGMFHSMSQAYQHPRRIPSFAVSGGDSMQDQIDDLQSQVNHLKWSQ